MKPPPPMFPALGYVTASAKPVATAASTAFPPAFMISTPASLAYFDMLTAIACSANVAGVPAVNRHPAGNAERTAASDTRAGSRRSTIAIGGAVPAAAGLGCCRQPTKSNATSAAGERAEDEICVRTISPRKMGPLGWFPSAPFGNLTGTGKTREPRGLGRCSEQQRLSG